MENNKFVRGFSREPWYKHHSETESPETQELMEGPRKWASFFDDQVVNYLSGYPIEDPEALHEKINEYFIQWTSPFLDKTLKEAMKRTVENPDESSAINELSFHLINQETLVLWHSLLMPDRMAPYDAGDLHLIQARLALANIPIIKRLRKETAAQKQYEIPSGIIKALTGVATEIDAEIVNLEIMKMLLKGGTSADAPSDSASQLIFVPAPPRFESGYRNSSRASDFLVFDPANHQVHGQQTKAGGSTSSQEARFTSNGKLYIGNYNPDFVTVIDGIVDLGNSRFEPRSQKVVPDPGLISLEYLRDNLSIQEINKHPIFSYDAQAFMQARLYARQTNPNTQPQLKKAATRVGERILHGLYKKEQPPVTIQEVI